MSLHRYLDEAARRHPTNVAVRSPGADEISYQDLVGLSDRLRDRLVAMGIQPGHRVGVYMRKSIDTVAAIFGILKTGAAYVPVDPTAPSERNALILNDCRVSAAIVDTQTGVGADFLGGPDGANPHFIWLDGVGDGSSLRGRLDELDAESAAAQVPSVDVDADSLAYILYTSGSTGKPKGVMISQRNACSFVDWCTEVFEPVPEDRFSSHAPFHFDLSILDIYTSLRHGASLELIGEEMSKKPVELARFMAERRITVWYSAPSILALMAQFGNLESYDYGALRMVLFAGEVFPITHLRSLKLQLSHPRYFNLYGPTETNVCTYYEVPPKIPDDRTTPFPIGGVCSHLESLVIGDDGLAAPPGEEGELCISGPSVMEGYWGLSELAAERMIEHDGKQWYRTGDFVVEKPDGNYDFVGRRDRMIKKRGYRIELDEIESCLYQHPDVSAAAVVSTSDESAGVVVWAHLSPVGDAKLSLIQIKTFCSNRIPSYMIPDRVQVHPDLPRTSTDKVDYQALVSLSR